MSKGFLDCYIRVSSNIQRDEGNSLEVQESMGKEVAKKLGLKFRLHYEGSRSSTIHYRPVLEELKRKISKREVKNVWSENKSRLFRNLTDGLLFRRDFLDKYKITLYEGSTPTRLKLDSPQENLQYNILMTFNQYENEERRRKSQLGQVYKLEKVAPIKPVFLGGTPLFGYTNKDKLWTIEKKESKWVKFIFDSYENGMTVKQIKDLLDKNGIKPRRTQNQLWNPQTINIMLKNKSYTGIHKRHHKSVEKTYTYKVPKIINVGQYNRVQQLMKDNSIYHDNNKQHYSLLEEFLYCECGSRMGSRHLKTTSSLGYKVDTRTYYCFSKMRNWKTGDKNKCKNIKSLQMDSLNEYVINLVKNRVSKSNILKEKFKTEVLEDKFNKIKDIKETEKKLEKKLQIIQKEIDSIENNIAEVEVLKGLKKQEKSVADKVIKRYGEELEGRWKVYKEIEQEIDALGSDKKWLNWIEKYGKSLELKTSNEEKQKDFLKGVIDKIIIHSEYGYNTRQKKETQKGHSIEVVFKMKIVDDGYRIIDANSKPRKYEVIEGKKSMKSGIEKFITQRPKRKKKKMKKVI